MELEFVYSEAHELVTSFFTYTCKAIFRRSDLEKQWKTDIERRLPDKFREALDQDEFAAKIHKMGYNHLLVQACPVSDSRGFLSWLKERSAGDIYECLSPHMKQFPEELGAVRDKVVYYLENWYEHYFQHLDPAVLAQLKKEAETRSKQQVEKSRFDSYVEEVTNGLVFEQPEHLRKIVLTPQFHARPVNWIFPFETITWCHYAFDASGQADEEEPSSELREAAKGLSDINRLKILRYLRNGPRSYIDVVKHIGLAKSTVYEHMLILRSAGLIRSNIVGDSPSTYSLRREGIDKLNRELERWLSI